MSYRPPSPDELIDLSWLLDSALACGHGPRSIEFGNRLREALLRHHDGISRSHLGGGATTAACRDRCTGLLADLSKVLSRLHYGAAVGRVEFRHRVEALAGESGVAL